MPGIGVLAKIASTAGAVDRPTRTPPVGRHNRRGICVFSSRALRAANEALLAALSAIDPII
jgi:hypothetical protein